MSGGRGRRQGGQQETGKRGKGVEAGGAIGWAIGGTARGTERGTARETARG